LDLQIAPVLKGLPPLVIDYLLSQQEMTQLVKLIQQYADDDNVSQTLLHKALEKIKAVIKQSIKQQDYGEEILLSLCQCLVSIQHFELLRVCVKITQPLWIKPIWMYYRVYAEVNGNAGKCSYMNYLRLRESLENAQQEKDPRATALIGKFLDQYHESRNPSGFNILDTLFGGIGDDDEDPIDRLFGHLPDDLFSQLGEKTVEITKKNPPERMLKILAADYLSNNVTMMRNLLNDDPDALFAFLMLKAADDLGFDIGVTAEEIVECFTNQKTTSKPASFPFF
jgi:hypothetical protein